MASKVNREVWQLKMNGCLLNTSVCCFFTVREKRKKGKRRRCFILVCSLGGSRGQDLMRRRSYQGQCLTRAGWNQSCLFSLLCETVLHLSSVSLLNAWILENQARSRALHLDEPGRTATHTISAPGGGHSTNTWVWSDYSSLHSEQLVPPVRLSHGELGTATTQMFPFLRPKPTNQI